MKRLFGLFILVLIFLPSQPVSAGNDEYSQDDLELFLRYSGIHTEKLKGYLDETMLRPFEEAFNGKAEQALSAISAEIETVNARIVYKVQLTSLRKAKKYYTTDEISGFLDGDIERLENFDLFRDELEGEVVKIMAGEYRAWIADFPWMDDASRNALIERIQQFESVWIE